MMKRILALLLAVVMAAVCLVACGDDTGPTQIAGTAIQPSTPKPTLPASVEHRGSSLMEYDPDREIYITGNIYKDMHPSFDFIGMAGFTIYSKNPIDPNTVTVTLPTTHPYECFIFGGEAPRGTEYTEGSGYFPFYVYQTYRGFDFYSYDPESEEWTEELKEAWNALLEGLIADFQTITPEDFPPFYYCGVEIRFGEPPWPQEEITYVDITIGDETYRHDIGMIRLNTEENCPYDFPIEGMESTGNNMHLYYNDGIGNFQLFGDFAAEENMTVRGFDLLGSDCQILDLSVRVTSGGMTMSYEWDGVTPIELYKGDTFSFQAVFYDPCLEYVHYDLTMYGIVKVEIDGQMQGYLYQKRLEPKHQSYELYAIVFGGVDMEPYYRGYYYENYELWRKEYSKP